MNYIPEIITKDKVIIVRTTGELRTKELSAMCVLMRLKARDLKYKLIFDYSLSKNYISITEAYYWFSDYYDSIDKNLSDIPVAIISNVADKYFFDFVENRYTNIGIQIKVFTEEECALQWMYLIDQNQKVQNNKIMAK